MKRLRWVLLSLGVLLVGAGGAATWVYTHWGYPNALIYYEAMVTWPTHSLRHVQYWIDPKRALEVSRDSFAEGPASRHLIDAQQGRLYGFGPDTPPEGLMLSPLVQRQLQLEAQAYANGGIHSAGLISVSHAIGPVRHVVLNGRSALYYQSGFADATVGSIYEWRDARTLAPLQEADHYNSDDTTAIQRFGVVQRLPPGGVAADFFDPPEAHAPLWDRLHDWLHEHLTLG